MWKKADRKAPQFSVWLNNAWFPLGVRIVMSLFKSPDEIFVCSGCSLMGILSGEHPREGLMHLLYTCALNEQECPGAN